MYLQNSCQGMSDEKSNKWLTTRKIHLSHIPTLAMLQ
jgi:hypothetical protein